MNNYPRKIAEYEADLYRVPKSWWERIFRSKNGEIEIKHYEGGEQRIEIDLRSLKVPDGAQVSVLIDGQVVWQVPTRRGYAHLRQSSTEGKPIPEVQAGSAAEVRYQGETLAEGTFEPD